MKLLIKIRNILIGIIAYIIAHIHDWYCKHFSSGWVYLPWGMTIKEHIKVIDFYLNKRSKK